MSPFARWLSPFLSLPACIFYTAVTPLCPSRLCRRGFCLFVHAGLHLFSHHRRAFFMLFLRQLGRFDDAGEKFTGVCTLVPAVPRLASVHFSSHFSAGLAVSTMPVGNFPPCARSPLPFLDSPACIFLSISPPAWPSRCCRRGFCLLLHAGLHLSSHLRRAFFSRLSLRFAHLPSADRDFVSLCTPASTFLPLSGMQDAPDQPGHLHIISLIKHAAAIPASH